MDTFAGRDNQPPKPGDLIIHQDGDPGIVATVTANDVDIVFLSGSRCVFDKDDICNDPSILPYRFSCRNEPLTTQNLPKSNLEDQLADVRKIWTRLESGQGHSTIAKDIASALPWLDIKDLEEIVVAYNALVFEREELKDRFVDAYCNGTLQEFLRLCEDVSCYLEIPSSAIAFFRQKKIKTALKRIGFSTMDPFQLDACGKYARNHLIKARAGSGKTLCVTALATLALSEEKLTSDQVMVLAFNRRAAREVRNRISTAAKVQGVVNARTFHSLANRIVRPNKKILFDDGGLDISGHEQSKFAERVLKRIFNPAFKIKMFHYFRRELKDLERLGAGLAPNDYFTFRRSLQYFTLSGEKVKSKGEKYIADYLFEHGIEYAYEKVWDWKSDLTTDSTPYSPDFSISFNGRDYILEHWAVHPDDPSAKLPDWWEGGTAQEYQEQIKRKRAYWKARGIRLIETDTSLMDGGREAFESAVKQRIERSGIFAQELSRDEVVKRVFNNPHQISRIARMFLGFVQKCKKRAWSPKDVKAKVDELGAVEEKVRIFYELAIRFFAEYERQLANEDAIDFDDLMHLAIREVNAKGQDATFFDEKQSKIFLKDLRLLLIDEFQDVSPLYLELVDSIRQFNADFRMVCVGDDWQAINRFSGSDVKYLLDFAQLFPSSKISILPLNHRSTRAVIGAGNHVMQGHGEAGIAPNGAGEGNVKIQMIEDVFVCFSNRHDLREQLVRDRPYVSNAEVGPSNGKRRGLKPNEKNIAASLKASHEFIRECSVEAERDGVRLGKVLVLARTRHVFGIKIGDYAERLKRSIKGHGEQRMLSRLTIGSATVHAAKGEGADVVIILDATSRQFPKIHPDLGLFELFGEGVNQNMSDERRLFYVAVTRCKRNLLILTSREEASPFLPDIGKEDLVSSVVIVEDSSMEKDAWRKLQREWDETPGWVRSLASRDLFR
jgi:DNA helicase IV